MSNAHFESISGLESLKDVLENVGHFMNHHFNSRQISLSSVRFRKCINLV